MAKTNYLISGIGPGRGGVGALMQNLGPIAKKYGMRVVAQWNGPSIARLLSERRYVQLAKVVSLKLLNRVQFILVANSVTDRKIIFVHPQTAGFGTLFRLAKKNQLFLYVMDNSFFCMRSYNFHPGEKAECLKCIGNPQNADEICSPFPIPMRRAGNILALEQLKEIADQITFLCQNSNQRQLLKKHFGPDARCQIVGMNTGELRNWSPHELQSSQGRDEKPYILFHGSVAEPKGLDYVLGLAEGMPHRRFILPASKNELNHRALPENVQCRDVSWTTGLKELTQKASLVMNPSIWSAPIEGALLKSLAFNRNVATVRTQYGFENEIPEDVGLLRLPRDVSEAVVLVEDFLEGKGASAFKLQSRIEWLEKMKACNQFEHLVSSL